MKKQGILVVSFGTTHREAEVKSIKAVEDRMREACENATIYRAYTSSIVRTILSKRKEAVCSVEEALQQMKQDCVTEVIIQPTHLIYGEEYEKMVDAIKKNCSEFSSIKIGKPLLGDTLDMKAVAKIIHEEYPLDLETGLVLMGHGTKHYCNTVYAAMEYVCREQGYQNIFMGTVEAYPDLNIVIRKVKKACLKRVILVPFMLVAGDHAVNDMAGNEEESWKTCFQREGIKVQTVLKGLGEYPQIQQLYCSHMKQAI